MVARGVLILKIQSIPTVHFASSHCITIVTTWTVIVTNDTYLKISTRLSVSYFRACNFLSMWFMFHCFNTICRIETNGQIKSVGLVFCDMRPENVIN